MSFCACGGSDNGPGEQKRLNEIIDTQLKRERAVYRATHRLLLQGKAEVCVSDPLQGFIQEFVLGGGNFVSGEQWACEARLPRGSGGPPRIFF